MQGIMVSAMAMFLDRNIHLKGTANIGHGKEFTKVESFPGGKAGGKKPLTLGYLQDIHFQSLRKYIIISYFKMIM